MYVSSVYREFAIYSYTVSDQKVEMNEDESGIHRDHSLRPDIRVNVEYDQLCKSDGRKLRC